MAFLDNSGDIILDAVLTDAGRRRMAQGNFRITKFALGDDEIDYGLYTLNTGSAYTDLEIMQTPVFEAFTQTNANINYGLLSYSRTDLLYLPELKLNNKVPNAVHATGSVYYLAANSETTTKLTSVFGDRKFRLESGASSDTSILLESGLDTTDLKGTSTNRTTYIVNTSLLDQNYQVYADNRFIAGLLSNSPSGFFRNTSAGALEINMTPLVTSTAISSTPVLDNYSTFVAQGISNLVYFYDTATSDTDLSAVSGPRGTVAALNFVCDGELNATSTGTRSTKYSLFGSTDQTLFGSGEKYDYIDTQIYVVGGATTAQLQIPIRIIRYAGT
tara:strand:- start:1099 stop:2091 length:993 start_codon:yes stop_codon:yes gene_type:complete